ncbi:MAG: triose-phosphate isomerase [Alphaproteobacteria bacterium]|nr:triose-phosphate isomerase [Alphaproteobacteria bacterium]
MALPEALVAGNWKMNGVTANIAEITKLNKLMAGNNRGCEVVICPPATLISMLAGNGIENGIENGIKNGIENGIGIGAQDCHMATGGAHTGDISAVMLADLGCRYVIVGHSERRADHGETNDIVRAKAMAVQAQGMTAIICVGETGSEREEGATLKVVTSQLKNSIPDMAPDMAPDTAPDTATVDSTVIAYEPVWAIGTGKTPTVDDVAAVHAVIRGLLQDRFGQAGDAIRILYGGSVKASNAAELMAVANVNGALVGGASLKAQDFYGIIKTYQ